MIWSADSFFHVRLNDFSQAANAGRLSANRARPPLSGAPQRPKGIQPLADLRPAFLSQSPPSRPSSLTCRAQVAWPSFPSQRLGRRWFLQCLQPPAQDRQAPRQAHRPCMRPATRRLSWPNGPVLIRWEGGGLCRPVQRGALAPLISLARGPGGMFQNPRGASKDSFI